jgi:hypothetical protein
MIRLALALMLLAGGAQAQTSNAEYAAACQAAVGPLPAFSCADGVPVPVTVDGQTPATYTPGMTCDRPALLNNGSTSDGQCVPYSRILSLSTDAHQVSVMCRQKMIRSADSMDFDEIDVIAHNPATGATCWFQAKGADAPVNGAAVPSPTAATDDSFWQTPEAVAQDGCGNCHDNDPFMFSAFVGQVWAHVPVNPFGPYAHVAPQFGFGDWPTQSIAPRDNTCVGCHRIGTDQTCNSLTLWMTGRDIPPGADALASAYPLSHAMPPGFGQTEAAWNQIYAQSVDQLRACCDDPTQAMCQMEPIPGDAE